MAFKMKTTPIIKGTKRYKQMGRTLGQSITPKETDYTLTTGYGLDDLELQETENVNVENNGDDDVVLYEMDPNQMRGEDDFVIKDDTQEGTQINIEGDGGWRWDTGQSGTPSYMPGKPNVIGSGYENVTSSATPAPDVKYSPEFEAGIDDIMNRLRFSDGLGMTDKEGNERFTSAQKAKIRKGILNMTQKERKAILTGDIDVSSFKMYKNALPGGPVRKAMLENGYKHKWV